MTCIKTYAFTLLVCTCLLARRASSAEEPQEAVLSVRQYEVHSFEGVLKAIADGCSKRYPALKVKFDDAIASLQLRVDAALGALLETERFRPLANAKVTKDLIENAAGNIESLRGSAAKVSEAQCKQATGEMVMSDEQLRDVLTQLLEQHLSWPPY